MGFERFDRASAAAATKPPEVVVLTNGVISMTWQAYQMIGEPTYVEFFYDRAEQLVGIAPTSDKANGYQVRLPRVAGKELGEAKGKVSVRGATFFKYYDIEPSAKYTETPELVENMLVFQARPGKKEQVPRISRPEAAPDEEDPHDLASRNLEGRDV
jgi:hypothetical protein